ncbi:MAG: universal stress protein [Paracoccaceae bacterium]|nr:universal stress protein [Paracoccaceae bacterium]
MFKTILVAIDGSDPGARALDAAIDLAVKYSARLDILHVRMHGRPVEELERMAEVEHIVAHVAPKALPSSLPNASTMADLLAHAEHEARVVSEIADRLLDAARQNAHAAGARDVGIKSAGGDYADAILDTARDKGTDLIVMGRRGLGRVRSMLVGSVSNKVVQEAETAVLLVH